MTSPTGTNERQISSITEPSPYIVQQTLFGQDAVKQLNTSDFYLDAPNKGRLKYNDCYLILFYAENKESLELVRIWQLVAAQTAGPLFGAVNLIVERKLAETFMSLRSDPDGPLHWASLKSIPYILVYRGGWPVAFYNGQRAVQPLIDYAITLACEANYREPLQVALGMQSDTNYEMPNYQSSEMPKISTDFTEQKSLRNFNPSATTSPTSPSVTTPQASRPVQAGVATPISPA